MNLSIWHCLVLYCCGNASIERLAEKADLSVSLLNQAKILEKWDYKKAQFAKLLPRHKASLDILELLFGEFQADENKKAFVEQIIDRLKSTNKPSKLDKNGAKSDDFSDVMPDELSIQDKLDTVNQSYRHLVSGYTSKLANCQKILEDTIKFYAEEIAALKATKGKSNDFDEIAGRQRTLSYNAQALSRLIKLYIENFSS
ncbi:hypothetical protein [Nostoc sp.]|uniref:hypothetical protein n=1 Tax=Nostoc sp. TaxID=1180 RepID=UPI002FF8F4FC